MVLKTYVAIRRISHDGVIHGPGTDQPTIELDSELAATYLVDGTLEDLNAPSSVVSVEPPAESSNPIGLAPLPDGSTVEFVTDEETDEETNENADLDLDELDLPEDFRTDLNTATEAELKALKYIGAATAKKLIQARPLATLEAAKEASGLTDEQWSELESALKV